MWLLAMLRVIFSFLSLCCTVWSRIIRIVTRIVSVLQHFRFQNKLQCWSDNTPVHFKGVYIRWIVGGFFIQSVSFYWLKNGISHKLWDHVLCLVEIYCQTPIHQQTSTIYNVPQIVYNMYNILIFIVYSYGSKIQVISIYSFQGK